MAQNLEVCSISPELFERVKKFRFRKEKTSAAIIMKINVESMTIVEDDSVDEDTMSDLKIEDLEAELPTHEPRYVALSYCYNHDDGRVSYPLVFIFVSPQGIKPELQMMYAGSKLTLVNKCGFTKVYELRGTDELTEEWLLSKLQKR